MASVNWPWIRYPIWFQHSQRSLRRSHSLCSQLRADSHAKCWHPQHRDHRDPQNALTSQWWRKEKSIYFCRKLGTLPIQFVRYWSPFRSCFPSETEYSLTASRYVQQPHAIVGDSDPVSRTNRKSVTSPIQSDIIRSIAWQYDGDCVEVESLRQKQVGPSLLHCLTYHGLAYQGRAADDKHADRAAKHAEEQRYNMLNTKKLVSIFDLVPNCTNRSPQLLSYLNNYCKSRPKEVLQRGHSTARKRSTFIVLTFFQSLTFRSTGTS